MTTKNDKLKMPADEFDRIMGQVLGPEDQEKQGGTLNDVRKDELKHPGQLPTKRGPKFKDVRVTETPGSSPAPPPKLPKG